MDENREVNATEPKREKVRDNRTFACFPLFIYIIGRKKESEDIYMKHGYITVRRLKLTDFEIRVLIDALNARRLKQKASGVDNTAASDLILRLLDILES